MSARDVGQKLLSEIDEGGNLSQVGSMFSSLASLNAEADSTTKLLDILRVQIDPGYSSGIGLESLDILLSPFTVPHSYDAQSPSLYPSRIDGSHGVATSKPLILEITSPASNNGKSQLLLLLVAVMVLPDRFGDIPLGGQNAAVVYIDTDGHLLTGRLVQVLQHVVSSAIAGGSSTTAGQRPSLADIDMLVESCLQHVHILRPQSMAALLTALKDLPTYLYGDGTKHHSAHRKLAAIMLDSATAFYWNDRNDTEVSKITATGRHDILYRTGDKTPNFVQIKKLLSGLSEDFCCSVIYAASHPSHQSGDESIHSLSSSLPASWASFPTARLVVHRRSVRGFPTAVSAEEAARDMATRGQAMADGFFNVFINEFGAEGWPREVRESYRRSDRSRIILRIRNEGIVGE